VVACGKIKLPGRRRHRKEDKGQSKTETKKPPRLDGVIYLENRNSQLSDQQAGDSKLSGSLDDKE
jgi:hypothetical protein